LVATTVLLLATMILAAAAVAYFEKRDLGVNSPPDWRSRFIGVLKRNAQPS
jgi:hypothetical protein